MNMKPKRKHAGGWKIAYSGTVDLEQDDRDDLDSQRQDSHMSWTNEMGPFPAGEGVTDVNDSIHDEFKLGAEYGHDLQELTSDPPPVTKMTERPAEAYHDDNEWESTTLHLGLLNARHAWKFRSAELGSNQRMFEYKSKALTTWLPADHESIIDPGARQASNGFPIEAPEDGGRDGWMYEPDQEHTPTTQLDELGQIQEESEKQSPFVKTFSVRRRQR